VIHFGLERLRLARALPTGIGIDTRFGHRRTDHTQETCAMQGSRDKRIKKLAQEICQLMRNHSDRVEAIDAYDMARILFRKPNSHRPIQPVPSESHVAHT
jgi:hypothetical protein